MFVDEPTIRNSNLLPVNAKGEVLFLSVESFGIGGRTDTPILSSVFSFALNFLPLSIEDKMTVIDNVINRAVTDKGYYSSIIIDILLAIEIIFAYTNINITEKQKEDIYKIYDMFISTGAFKVIKEAVPSAELDFIYTHTYKFIEILYNYKNSALGIMETINADYGNTVYDAE
jgi:hypothetical protein